MVLVRNEIFSTFFIFGGTGKKRVFGVILERKNAFLDYKSKDWKKRNKRDFSKGISPLFW